MHKQILNVIHHHSFVFGPSAKITMTTLLMRSMRGFLAPPFPEFEAEPRIFPLGAFCPWACILASLLPVDLLQGFHLHSSDRRGHPPGHVWVGVFPTWELPGAASTACCLALLGPWPFCRSSSRFLLAWRISGCRFETGCRFGSDTSLWGLGGGDCVRD